MQYQSECLEALKSAAKISKPFEKVFMDTLKLFMAIPGKVNFLQMADTESSLSKPTVITSKMRPSRNRPVNHIRTIG